MQGPFYEQMGTYAVYKDNHRYWVNPDKGYAVDSDTVADDGKFKEIEETLAAELLMFVMKYLKENPHKARMPATICQIDTLKGNFVVSDSLIRLIPTLPDAIWEQKGKSNMNDEDERVEFAKLDYPLCRCKDWYGDLHLFSNDVYELFPDIGQRIGDARYQT